MGNKHLSRRAVLVASILAGGASAVRAQGQQLPFPTGPLPAQNFDGVRVMNIEMLKALTARPGVVEVAGRRIPGDGGGGTFWWDDASDAPPDDALVIRPASGAGGRYRRLFSGFIDVRWFGSDVQGAIDAAQSTFGTVLISGVVEVDATLVLRTGVNLTFSGGAKLLWTGARTATCVETDPRDITRNATWRGLTIDTGTNFSGTALYIHSAHNISADVITLITTGATSIAFKMYADSVSGQVPGIKRNVTACVFGSIVQQGQCGTFIETGGVSSGNFGDPQVVSLNTFNSLVASNCARFGIHFRQWTDNNAFPGINRVSLNADEAIGLQVGGQNETDNLGVYSNKFGVLAIDTFGKAKGRVAVRLSRSKLTVIDALYNHPAAEGGIFQAEPSALSYDVSYQDDSSAQIVRYQRKVDHVEGAVGYNSSRPLLLVNDMSTSIAVDDPPNPGQNITFTVIVTAQTGEASGIAWCRVRKSHGIPAAAAIRGGPNFYVLPSGGSLSGTTGPKGKLNVSPGRDGHLYIENRLGTGTSLVLTIVGRSQLP